MTELEKIDARLDRMTLQICDLEAIQLRQLLDFKGMKKLQDFDLNISSQSERSEEYIQYQEARKKLIKFLYEKQNL